MVVAASLLAAVLTSPAYCRRHQAILLHQRQVDNVHLGDAAGRITVWDNLVRKDVGQVAGGSMAIAIGLATCAAFCSALAVVFQRVALESAPTSDDLSPRLILHALRSRGWLIGLALMLGTFGFQATALRFGQLNVVQPVLT